MKSYIKLSVLAFCLVLVGSGCWGDDLALVGDCVAETPWGSCIDENGLDYALLGTWTLEDQTVSSPAGSITNPFNGRSLTFGAGTIDTTDTLGNIISITHGTFFEDWGPEEIDPVSVSTPDGDISSECDILGGAGGNWTAIADVNLDDPSLPDIISLQIVPDGGGAQVKCKATGIEIESNRASTPLGLGYAVESPDGNYVPYNYNLNESWSVLILTNINPYGPVNQFTFTR